ncbi:dTDP-glucose 4,6-dehydratase [Lentilactobacillus farraginis]|uniref:dTDP-glucose 4,6-dehydratase n=2 Tax=Lentilactobacillus farraginis DSM 18382 = JCM 14108 TaxID=1423743 RepID=A0A0R1W743_9LACO|nr:dTDP-glucose 4,6-dehydratase [Lentilactobacillus farraginis]KRM11449.1 dTDP-glucose 4,6-dehydratase [Lentilactobacillus farraginis DSM 18382 = JCM 14108]
MNILVTGGAGFIGSNFIRQLLRNHPDDRIVNFDLLTYAGHLSNLADISPQANYVFVKGDIANRQAAEAVIYDNQIDVVVNFAAESHVDRSILDAAPFIHSNFLGVKTLLEAVRKYRLKKFIQISTDEVYGPTTSRFPADENARLNPSSPYAASKAAADLLALSYFKTFGVPLCITRSANNYGRYQFPEKLIPLMVTNTLRGRTLPIYGNGQNSRDWLNVDDNCRAIELVMENGRPGEIYNVAAHQYRTNLQVVNRIKKQLAAWQPQIKFVADRPANDTGYAINDTKIRRQLGWQPEFDFETGIGDTIDWYVIHPEWWRPLLKNVKNR